MIHWIEITNNKNNQEVFLSHVPDEEFLPLMKLLYDLELIISYGIYDENGEMSGAGALDKGLFQTLLQNEKIHK
ncbi:hypothetical protein CG435_12880 [Pantoea ananatis]|uniref:hypothetical protein n=1 Tax=Pantoea ananas TaxID=553 RepID=UPI000CF53756|nr:hypothetical protein [Pantoea ananatis]PQK99965.1 hypothetical protein CG435_12880 [Pantoea ananatis]REF11099.1 hypothetical protein C7428_0270 [Pantoea ananatis]